MNTNTRLIDIPATILAILVIIGGIVLLFFDKINYVELSFFIVAGMGLIGYNAALKAPSPAQAQQLSTLTETAQAHTDQITAQQQQLGQVQDLAVRAANTVSYLQQQVQAPAPVPQPQTPVQGMVNLATMPQPQFMQPVPQYVDYHRHFGDSQVMPIVAQSTQKIPTV